MVIKNIKIPEDRLPVLIGKNGNIKRSIEKKTMTKITIGEEISIEGDSLDVLDADNIVKAIGRGFSPDNAMLLTNEENALLIVDLPKNEHDLRRVRSRIIGAGGKSRRNIERLTRTHISVYGKTASIIGKYADVNIAEQAVKKIIKGVSHRFVYQFLEDKQHVREKG